jgi:hypothetical protein
VGALNSFIRHVFGLGHYTIYQYLPSVKTKVHLNFSLLMHKKFLSMIIVLVSRFTCRFLLNLCYLNLKPWCFNCTFNLSPIKTILKMWYCWNIQVSCVHIFCHRLNMLISISPTNLSHLVENKENTTHLMHQGFFYIYLNKPSVQIWIIRVIFIWQ